MKLMHGSFPLAVIVSHHFEITTGATGEIAGVQGSLATCRTLLLASICTYQQMQSHPAVPASSIGRA